MALHFNALKKIAGVLLKLDHNNILKEESNKYKLMMALRVEKINSQFRCLFCNQSLFGPLRNDPHNLANSMLVSLLTTLSREKAISLCSKTVFNLKVDYFHEALLCCLGK